MLSYKIKVQHESFGLVLDQTFSDSVQFKLFLKMVNSSLETKTDLDFFNGVDFLIHIPYKHLVNSLVLTSSEAAPTASRLGCISTNMLLKLG